MRSSFYQEKKTVGKGGKIQPRWIFSVFFAENVFVFQEKSPERVTPESFCNTPSPLFY